MLNWYACVLRPCTRRLIKLTLAASLQQENCGDAREQEIEVAMTAFMCGIGPRLESMLKKGAKGDVYLFCEDGVGRRTVVDIVYYSEIRTVLELCSLEGCNFSD